MVAFCAARACKLDPRAARTVAVETLVIRSSGMWRLRMWRLTIIYVTYMLRY